MICTEFQAELTMSGHAKLCDWSATEEGRGCNLGYRAGVACAALEVSGRFLAALPCLTLSGSLKGLQRW